MRIHGALLAGLLGPAAIALAAAGCNTPGPTGPSAFDPGSAAGIDIPSLPATPGTWYRPGVGVTWQLQLSGEPRIHHDAEVYILDLFGTPDSVLLQLHERGSRVFCYFSAGSLEDGRPDEDRFPPHVVGRRLDNYPQERWLDIRDPEVLTLMRARMDLAAQRGCDGVEPDNVDGYTHATGFPLTAADQLAFNGELAASAHARGLSATLKNAVDLVAQLAGAFDSAVNEECHTYQECDRLRPFIEAGKPVLNVEYAVDEWDAKEQAATICPESETLGLRTLILPLDLDDAFRVACF